MVQQTKDKNQPTPGPWRVEGNRYICGPGPGRNWSLRVIATVIGANSTTDATLIAAAVNSHADLLAACEGALVATDSQEGNHTLCQYCDEPRGMHKLSCWVPQMRAAVAKARGTA